MNGLTFDSLLTIEDVRRVTRAGRRQIYAWVANGDLVVIRLGRAIRVRPTDLDAFLASRVQGCRSEGVC